MIEISMVRKLFTVDIIVKYWWVTAVDAKLISWEC